MRQYKSSVSNRLTGFEKNDIITNWHCLRRAVMFLYSFFFKTIVSKFAETSKDGHSPGSPILAFAQTFFMSFGKKPPTLSCEEWEEKAFNKLFSFQARAQDTCKKAVKHHRKQTSKRNKGRETGQSHYDYRPRWLVLTKTESEYTYLKRFREIQCNIAHRGKGDGRGKPDGNNQGR